MRDHFVDVEGLDEHLDELPQLVLPPVGFHLLGKDLDLPTGQFRCEAHVLAAPADGVALLVLGHHHFHPRRFIIENDLCHLGRNQRVDDERGSVGGPLDDVDALTLQLAHDGLNPAAPHPDAGTHGVDPRIIRNHRDLGATPWVAGGGNDLHDPVVDLRNFLGKQLYEKFVARS